MKKITCAIFALLLMAASPFGGGNSKAPIDISADSLEVLQNQKKAIFSGNVIANQNNMTINANKMTVYYAGDSTSSNAISKIEVDGNVVLTTPKESARGSSGVYDVTRDFVTLVGNVVLTRDKNVLKGSRLDYDIKNGQSRLTGGVTGTAPNGQPTGGRVRGLFVPEGKQ